MPPPRRQKTVTSQSIVRDECCGFRKTVNSLRQQPMRRVLQSGKMQNSYKGCNLFKQQTTCNFLNSNRSKWTLFIPSPTLPRRQRSYTNPPSSSVVVALTTSPSWCCRRRRPNGNSSRKVAVCGRSSSTTRRRI